MLKFAGRRCGHLLALCALLLAGVQAQPARAQGGAYPDHALRLVVPYSPGGNIDITARLVAQSLGDALGQPVVVENRPGAGGLVGAAFVAHAQADGYTLLLGSTGSLTTAPAIYKNVAFDPVGDFTAIGAIQTVPLVLNVSNKVPAANYAELVALSKKDAINAGVTGVGSLAHLALVLIAQQTGLATLNVPYKGSGPAMTDLLGDHVSLVVDQLNSSLPYLRERSIKALAQLGATRSPLLPDVPTMAEQGHAGLEAATFTGLFAPAGLPPGVEDKLAAALARVVGDAEVRKRFEEMGASVMEMDRKQFRRFVADDLARWKKIAREASITAE